MTRTIPFLLVLAVAPGCARIGPDRAVGPRPRSDALISDYFDVVVTRPPEAVVRRFDLDTTFYAKYANANGIPILASARVPDEAVVVARDIVTHMLSVRPDLRADIIARGGRVGVMAITEMTTDIPEQRDWKKPAYDDPRLTDGERARYYQPGGIASMTDAEYWNRRARGMGGTFTTCAEENILGYPGTRYFGENILVHEFSHSIMSSVRRVDPELYAELKAAYAEAMDKGLYGRHYAANTMAEYWAEGTQWWFWSNYSATFDGQRVWTPEEFKRYDPKLYSILERVYPDHHIPLDVYHNFEGSIRRPRRRATSP
ncbi:MAG TPA: hypothetical protein VF188_01680 [Longimicrobiales bacterium]